MNFNPDTSKNIEYYHMSTFVKNYELEQIRAKAECYDMFMRYYKSVSDSVNSVRMRPMFTTHVPITDNKNYTIVDDEFKHKEYFTGETLEEAFIKFLVWRDSLERK